MILGHGIKSLSRLYPFKFFEGCLPKFYLVHYWILGLIYRHFHCLHGIVVRSTLPFGQNTASSHYSEIFPVSILVCIYTIKNQRDYVKLTQMRSWCADVGILVVIFVRFVVFLFQLEGNILNYQESIAIFVKGALCHKKPFGIV